MLEQLREHLFGELLLSAILRLTASPPPSRRLQTHPVRLRNDELLRVGCPVDDVGTWMGLDGHEPDNCLSMK